MHYPHTTKDNKGNVIHYKDSNGYERWYEYDSNNNLIHCKNSIGYEDWYECDSNNNIIHYKNSKGVEDWYDSDGNRIDDPDKVIELSLEDIAKKFNVSLENLRIKEL